LLIWDNDELEIVGSYRIAIGREILEKLGSSGFYTSTLFDFTKELTDKYIVQSIELGRSFVQKKYWNTNALHYLWMGIGAFLAKNDGIRYLFGGVSLSANYPEEARRMIVYYFNKWFQSETKLAKSKKQFSLPENFKPELDEMFNGKNYKEDLRILKNRLKPMGFTVPVLYKHYSDLCEDGGVKFLDFGYDESFSDCLDGLILVDLTLIKKEKKERYINKFKEEAAEVA
jgi:hypothetical protein